MIGKINISGQLLINRKDSWKSVICPLNDGDNCGDWCALFGEPEPILKGINVKIPMPREELSKSIIELEKQRLKPKGIRLYLCHKQFTFEEFTDER